MVAAALAPDAGVSAGRAAGEGVNILALDLGTRTGWALAESGRVESGVQVFDVRRGESPGMRFVRFNRWLPVVALGVRETDPRLAERDPRPPRKVGAIVYEQTHHRGGAATEIAAGFATRVQEFCARYGIEHAAVHSATLKKYVTGSGRGDKAAMGEAARRRGWLDHCVSVVVDDNEGDAICLLHYALAEIVPAGRT